MIAHPHNSRFCRIRNTRLCNGSRCFLLSLMMSIGTGELVPIMAYYSGRFFQGICKVIITGKLGGARLFAVVDPCCEKFLWVGCLVRSNNFSNVSRRSPMYEGVDVGNVSEHASHFAVLYMFFSYLIPLDS